MEKTLFIYLEHPFQVDEAEAMYFKRYRIDTQQLLLEQLRPQLTPTAAPPYITSRRMWLPPAPVNLIRNLSEERHLQLGLYLHPARHHLHQHHHGTV